MLKFLFTTKLEAQQYIFKLVLERKNIQKGVGAIKTRETQLLSTRYRGKISSSSLSHSSKYLKLKTKSMVSDHVPCRYILGFRNLNSRTGGRLYGLVSIRTDAMPSDLCICLSSLRIKIFFPFLKCICLYIVFPLWPLAWYLFEQHLVSLLLKELFKAQLALMELMLSFRFRLPYHQLEISDGHRHKHIARRSRPVATMLPPKVHHAFSLGQNLPRLGYPLKTGIYLFLSYLMNKADGQS